MKDEADGVRELAQRIMQYLERHPQAGDSLEGIVEWWLCQSVSESTIATAGAAIAQLVAAGQLTATTLADGTTIYKLKSKQK